MTKLLRYYETGSSKDFAGFYVEHKEKMFRNAMKLIPAWKSGRRELAEDLVQNTFTKVFKTKGRASAYSADHGVPVEAWLRTILTNTYFDLPTDRESVQKNEASDFFANVPEKATSEAREVAHMSEFVQALEKAIAELPGVERLVAEGVLLEGKKQKEVAAELGVSKATVCRELKKAKKKLADKLADFR
jgi:RNA polymerase sigma factor (sigma-70 family)